MKALRQAQGDKWNVAKKDLNIVRLSLSKPCILIIAIIGKILILSNKHKTL